MLDGIIALIALERSGTVSEAATQLRLTQSAVSKRIHSLEIELDLKLVEPDGRKLRLTQNAMTLLLKAKPLIKEITDLRNLEQTITPRTLTIGISDSIASSFGPKLLRKVLQDFKEINLEIHIHRSTLILDYLRFGRYDLGLISGVPNGNDLIWNELLEENMILLNNFKSKSKSKIVYTIETQSSTWKEIGKKTLNHEKFKDSHFIFVESFTAAAQMANEGFGNALIPNSLSKALKINKSTINKLFPPLKRKIYLVSRKSLYQIQTASDLLNSFKIHAPSVM